MFRFNNIDTVNSLIDKAQPKRQAKPSQSKLKAWAEVVYIIRSVPCPVPRPRPGESFQSPNQQSDFNQIFKASPNQ